MQRVVRFSDNPIISTETPGTDERLGTNFNGPCLIRVPDWLPNPLGAYYLYFGHHAGTYIRLAYADQPTGPWRIHPPGVMPLEASGFVGHLASPDIHIDDENRQLRLYYHGGTSQADRAAIDPVVKGQAMFIGQMTKVAVSSDGLTFAPRPEIMASPYLRVFPFRGQFYGIAMPGLLWRSADGLSPFEPGPFLFCDGVDFGPAMYQERTIRHLAILPGTDDQLHVWMTYRLEAPESIYYATIDARHEDWRHWTATEPVVVLSPETSWEGAGEPLEISRSGAVHRLARQLRDPDVVLVDGTLYLTYAAGGESSLALARIDGLAL